MWGHFFTFSLFFLSIFLGASGEQDVPSVKTTKKTKGKKKGEKKGKSKISIFDDDSPNIFDDPLNATSK